MNFTSVYDTFPHISNLCREASLALVSDCSCFKYIWMLKISHFIFWNRHLSTLWTAQLKTQTRIARWLALRRESCVQTQCDFAVVLPNVHIRNIWSRWGKDHRVLLYIHNYLMRKLFEIVPHVLNLDFLYTIIFFFFSDTGELNRHPSMFLLLLVLGRLYPSPMDGTYSALSMAPFVPFIMR